MAPAKIMPRFSDGERVYCMQGKLPWDAKIVEVRPIKDEETKKKIVGHEYFVHYQGWKRTWDEAVSDDRLWKINEETTADYKRLHQEAKDQRNKVKKGSTSHRKSGAGNASSDRGSIRDSEDRSSIGAMPRGTKRARENDIEKVSAPDSKTRKTSKLRDGTNARSRTQQDEFLKKSSIKFPIPDEIKSLLVDDWENITKSLQLVPLPHVHPVHEILEDYTNHESPKRVRGSADHDVLEEVVQGIREYFDKSLGRILLYRFERQQWLDLHERMMGLVKPDKANGDDDLDQVDLEGKTPSDVYGAEHLCRLFVSFGELIAQTNMDRQAVDKLREEVMKFTRWLSKNSGTYFTKEYLSTGEEKGRATV